MKSIRSYFAGTYTMRIILGALFAAIVADGVITQFLVFNGLASEGNPFLKVLVYQQTFLAIKVIGGALAALYLWGIYRRHSNVALAFSSLFLSIYTFIIFWNLSFLV